MLLAILACSARSRKGAERDRDGWRRAQNKIVFHFFVRVGGVEPPHFVYIPSLQDQFHFIKLQNAMLVTQAFSTKWVGVAFQSSK